MCNMVISFCLMVTVRLTELNLNTQSYKQQASKLAGYVSNTIEANESHLTRRIDKLLS